MPTISYVDYIDRTVVEGLFTVYKHSFIDATVLAENITSKQLFSSFAIRQFNDADVDQCAAIQALGVGRSCVIKLLGQDQYVLIERTAN